MGIVGHHREIARICLTALRERKIRGRFGLGGGNALLLHGTPCARATQDIDVFVGDLTEFRDAADAIAASLADHGYTVALVDQFGGLGDAWPEIEDEETGLAEWEVTTPDGESTIQLQAGFFDLFGEPVTIDGIPVIGLDDIGGHKTAALVLLTELSTRSCRFPGHQSRSVARFLARDIRGRREGSGVAGCSACRETSRHRQSMGALPAA